jgi:23S rRNA (uridine2552-2'-O)-methyltransferase
VKKTNSDSWLREHFSDTYVKRAKSEGFRARSVYKLMEINQRYKIIKHGIVAVDLGAAPGGWSQYLAHLVGQKGKIFALDVLPMQPIRGVEFIQGDFTRDETVKILCSHLGGRGVDLVLSDMAPNLSGIKVVDQILAIELAKKAFSFASLVLGSNGVFIIKVFHGEEFEDFLRNLRKSFSEVKVIKPEASRSRSSEVFLLARNLRKDVIGSIKVV